MRPNFEHVMLFTHDLEEKWPGPCSTYTWSNWGSPFFFGTGLAWWSSDLSVWISVLLWEALWIWFDYELQVKERALELAAAMETEDGVTGAVKAFFKHLPPRNPPTQPSPMPTGFFERCFGSVRKCFGCSWVFNCMYFSFIFSSFELPGALPTDGTLIGFQPM